MRLKADLQLLLVTVIWGGAFAVVRYAANHNTVFLFNGIRFILGTLVLLPFTKLKGVYHRSNIIYVVLAGFALYAASSFQQAGMNTTTAGNGGFITSLYVVIVPLILWIVWRERPSPLISFAVPMAIGGVFLLSTGGSFQPKPGDVLMFISSFFWAMHVVVVSKAQGRIDPLPFAMGQYLLCGVLNFATGIFIEHPSQSDLLYILPAILYTGIFSVGLGFTLQVIAQKHTPPNDTALILSLEGTFAAIFGWIFLHETLRPLQIAGCSLILLSVILVQVKNGKMKSV
jgi:drug/metabolite transporter (DMT)-like permease